MKFVYDIETYDSTTHVLNCMSFHKAHKERRFQSCDFFRCGFSSDWNFPSFHTSCTYICILHTSCTKTLSPSMSSLLSHLCPNSQCLCWWVLDVSVYQLLWFLARHCRFHMKGPTVFDDICLILTN